MDYYKYTYICICVFLVALQDTNTITRSSNPKNRTLREDMYRRPGVSLSYAEVKLIPKLLNIHSIMQSKYRSVKISL